MDQMTRRVFGVAGFALLLAASASFAQQPPPVRVRGTVEAVDGPVLTVKSRDGQTTYKVKVADNVAVRGRSIEPNTERTQISGSALRSIRRHHHSTSGLYSAEPAGEGEIALRTRRTSVPRTARRLSAKLRI